MTTIDPIAALEAAEGSWHASGDHEAVAARGRGRWSLFLRNRLAVVGLAFLAIEITVVALAPWVAPYDPNEQSLLHRLEAPSSTHWLGTDTFGRDVLSRLIWGGRVSLEGAAIAVAVGLSVGLVFGLLAGYVGRWLDNVVSRVMDMLMAIPGLILAFTVVDVLGPGLGNAMIAVGIATIPSFYRIARGQTQIVSAETFVEASRMIGCKTRRILGVHLLPNTLSPVIVQLALALGAAVTAEASLSFIGLGVQPPTASWGSMLREATTSMRTRPVLVIAPGVVIALTVLAFTLVGDGLRDALGTGRESQMTR